MKVLLHVNYYEGAGKFETLFKIIKAVGADVVELRAKNYYNMGKEITQEIIVKYLSDMLRLKH